MRQMRESTPYTGKPRIMRAGHQGAAPQVSDETQPMMSDEGDPSSTPPLTMSQIGRISDNRDRAVDRQCELVASRRRGHSWPPAEPKARSDPKRPRREEEDDEMMSNVGNIDMPASSSGQAAATPQDVLSPAPRPPVKVGSKACDYWQPR